MTVTPGPIPLPVMHYFCLSRRQQCQHLRQEGPYYACGHNGHKHTVTTFMDAANRLPAPAWCPLRGKNDG